jgi:hypothetical protein
MHDRQVTQISAAYFSGKIGEKIMFAIQIATAWKNELKFETLPFSVHFRDAS